MNKIIDNDHHIDSADIYMLMLWFSIHHIWHLMLNMYPNDIDKQKIHFQEMTNNDHSNKHLPNDMGQLRTNLEFIESFNSTYDVHTECQYDLMDICIDKNHS